MWKEKHLSSTESSKTSENNYVNEYIASLKDQIESLKGEILFLRQELRLRNVPPKLKCIDINGGGKLLYIREKIPSLSFHSNVSIAGFFVELNVRKKKWLLCYSYNIVRKGVPALPF